MSIWSIFKLFSKTSIIHEPTIVYDEKGLGMIGCPPVVVSLDVNPINRWIRNIFDKYSFLQVISHLWGSTRIFLSWSKSWLLNRSESMTLSPCVDKSFLVLESLLILRQYVALPVPTEVLFMCTPFSSLHKGVFLVYLLLTS